MRGRSSVGQSQKNVHEAAHGFVAHLLGDDTAWRLGRVSFNPLKHVDPLGTILLPEILLLLLSCSPLWRAPRSSNRTHKEGENEDSLEYYCGHRLRPVGRQLLHPQSLPEPTLAFFMKLSACSSIIQGGGKRRAQNL
jgi:hypothetical protein